MAAPTLTFRFVRPKDHDAPRRVADAFAAVMVPRGGSLAGDSDHIFARLHAALPPFAISRSDGGIVAHASSWPGGPGFHQALLAAAEEVAREADVDLSVEDSTGYHTALDRAALEAALAAALAGAARDGLAFLDRAGPTAHLQFGMPLPGRPGALRVGGDPPGVYTPEGPRDRAWLEKLASGEIPAADFYPWWPAELNDDGHRRLSRWLVESHVTWRPAVTDEQRALRATTLEGLRRGAEGAPFEYVKLLACLEHLASGQPADPPAGLRHLPRGAELAGGWTAVVPGHFETAPPSKEGVPAVVKVGTVHLDGRLRIETMAQPAPEEVPLAERIAHHFAQPQAAGAEQRRSEDPPFAGYLVERKLPGGGVGLVASLVGATSHLIVRMIAAPDLDPSVPAAVWASIAPPQESPRFLAI
jgi:hypothetical protein